MAKSDQYKKLIDAFKKHKKDKGKLPNWTDSNLMKLRDRFRKQARKSRGDWTIDFYETLQELNKESAKRKLPQGTA